MVAIVADGWGLGGCVCDLECDGHDCGCECAVEVEVDEGSSSSSERAEYYVHGSISSGPERSTVIHIHDLARPHPAAAYIVRLLKFLSKC